MRRADRLFRIVEYLKARRQVVTADQLAAELEVSARTIYRDIADLGASGVPVIGEAGVGYMLDRDYLVQPLMFEVEELDEALDQHLVNRDLGLLGTQSYDAGQRLRMQIGDEPTDLLMAGTSLSERRFQGDALLKGGCKKRGEE